MIPEISFSAILWPLDAANVQLCPFPRRPEIRGANSLVPNRNYGNARETWFDGHSQLYL